MTQMVKNTTITIAVPIELMMDTEVDAVIDIKLGGNPRVLETDDYGEYLILSDCTLEDIVKLFDLAPYVTLEKTFEDFIHTGVDLEVDFIVGLNVEMDL